MSKKILIKETPNIFDDHFLDIIGNEFKFDHIKGQAEWLKNSVDAYRREGITQEEQYVVFRFTDQGVPKPMVECIDFVGMDQVDIEKAFKRWGDPKASKRGKGVKTYGGHGNGGKFYMRQMFKESRFITYKNGVLNIFGFNENRKYGYAEGYENKKMKPKEAFSFAELESLPIPKEIKEKVLSGKTGFTVIQGVGPENLRGKFKIARDMEKFKNHPQARRILLYANVSVIYNNNSMYGLLRPEDLPPLEKFEIPRVIEIPKILPVVFSEEKGRTVEMANEKFATGRLVLKTSADPLDRGTKFGELNRIDFLGEIGVIGSYQLYEMGVKGFPDAAFIYGECEAPILEDPENDCVTNDRSKLIKNERTDALIDWIAKEIDKVAAEITAIKREKQKASQKEITSKFNDVLNQWKNKHMKKILSELFGGDGGSSSGGDGGGHFGTEVTPPINGFDFKFPQAEIQINTPAKITLKVSVPESLPIGAAILLSGNTDCVIFDESKYFIKPDCLKTTPEGQEVAFINMDILGQKLGESILTAKAGKLSALTKITVIEQKKENKKGGAFPRVLLSSHDPDPLGSDTIHLGERDPVVYQRPQDVPESIYWINTTSPMASKIYDKFNFDSIQWRNFLFDRYVDIFVKESIHELYRKDPENFDADAVDSKIAEVIRKVHQSAKEDLEDFLFDESYTVDSIKQNEI